MDKLKKQSNLDVNTVNYKNEMIMMIWSLMQYWHDFYGKHQTLSEYSLALLY